MNKKMTGYLVTAAIAAAVVWASNNIDAVEEFIG